MLECLSPVFRRRGSVLTVLLFAFADPKRVKPLFRKLSGRKDPEK